jgi:organic hydroperoxide reductase OsmC/OhrA
MASPPEFGGPGDAWSPEHLLLASVQACFLFTLRAVAKNAQLTFVELEIDADGTLDRVDGVSRFSEIVLRPTVTILPGTDRGRVHQALERSKKACLISNSLSTPVRMEPAIIEQPGQAAA